MLKTTKGFTLVELMIVVGMVGVLTAIAIPQYSQYTKRAKFSELVSRAGSLKTAVTVCFQLQNDLDVCDGNEHGIPGDITGQPATEPLVSLTTANGTVTATGGNPVDGLTYILTPSPTGTGNSEALVWAQLGNCNSAGNNLC